MALNSEQQVRLTIYGFLAFIVLVAGYFVVQILNQANNLTSSTGSATAKNQGDYEITETSILDNQKFKELSAVKVIDSVASSSLGTTTTSLDLTPAQLGALPRNPNPFSSSF